MSMKNSNDTIGNRTRDLPTCSAVPQPTALPLAPKLVIQGSKIDISHVEVSNLGYCLIIVPEDGYK